MDKKTKILMAVTILVSVIALSSAVALIIKTVKVIKTSKGTKVSYCETLKKSECWQDKLNQDIIFI